MLTGWKMLTFNAVLALVGVAQSFDWTAVLGASPYVGYVMTAVGVINMVLRSITVGPSVLTPSSFLKK